MRPEILALCLVVAGVFGAPADVVTVVDSLVKSDGHGNYEFWFQLSDETYRWQTGEVKTASNGKPFVFTSGGYRYYDIAREVFHTIQFEADENGYRAKVTEEPLPPGAPPPRLVAGAGGG
ncbi:larval cuticle protein 1-like isoform X1 [Plodia interpunctella]|uniref:larval cuticle protein 1-like isoform X2 n=1 Tax=Plodia interpunctella TaxID=58824 RepID=UPI002368F346|nr:larval cuticle protein 1-like isoform X1 [Plodia interpunctella]XP_053602389.1 larval cuticle protein 1-like isoform X2 [Plodia interpunctella]